METNPLFLKVEKNAFSHFAYLPKLLGFEVVDTPQGTIINGACGTSMFNIVCDTNLDQANLEQEINQIIAYFKGQPFAWWLGTSAQPQGLAKILQDKGFVFETAEYAMVYDLDAFTETQPAGIEIQKVTTTKQLDDFISVLEPYDDTARGFYSKLTDPNISTQEKLFVGYENQMPMIIGLLHFCEDSAGIFSLITIDEKRGKGYGTQMMQYLMEYAKVNGFNYCTLSASSNSGFRIYERLGFKVVGQFECLEWCGNDPIRN